MKEETFGIECQHHYGITTHEQRPGETVEQCVYRLIRTAWHAPREDGRGLSDDNHTWTVERSEAVDGWSRVCIFKNEKSPPWALNPWRVADGPGARWFSQEYRIATRGTIEREIADRLNWAQKWETDAERQRDTIRGRKARAKYSDLAETAKRQALLIETRWPQFSGKPRSGWQERMHEHLVPVIA